MYEGSGFEPKVISGVNRNRTLRDSGVSYRWNDLYSICGIIRFFTAPTGVGTYLYVHGLESRYSSQVVSVEGRAG